MVNCKSYHAVWSPILSPWDALLYHNPHPFYVPYQFWVSGRFLLTESQTNFFRIFPSCSRAAPKLGIWWISRRTCSGWINANAPRPSSAPHFSKMSTHSDILPHGTFPSRTTLPKGSAPFARDYLYCYPSPRLSRYLSIQERVTALSRLPSIVITSAWGVQGVELFPISQMVYYTRGIWWW